MFWRIFSNQGDALKTSFTGLHYLVGGSAEAAAGMAKTAAAYVAPLKSDSHYPDATITPPLSTAPDAEALARLPF